MFAVHPVHSEAVAGIVGRADVLAAVFFLLSTISYHNHIESRDSNNSIRCSDKNGNCVKDNNSGESGVASVGLVSAVIFSALAMLSKEQGVTALGICFVTDFIVGKRGSEKNRSLFLIAASTLGLILTRGAVMGFKAPAFAKADNPAAGSESMLTRTLTFFYLPVFNAGLLICPSVLSFDWSMDAVPLVESVWERRNLASLAFYTMLAVILKKRAFPAVFGSGRRRSRSGNNNTKLAKTNDLDTFSTISLCLCVLPFLPASNLLFYVGFVVAERVLYIPSIGFCLASGYAVAKVLCSRNKKKSKISLFCLFAVVCSPLLLRTLIRNSDWRDEESLYQSGLRVNPPKGKTKQKREHPFTGEMGRGDPFVSRRS